MLRSECYVKQLYQLLIRSQVTHLHSNAGHGRWLQAGPICQKCQARRFHVSSYVQSVKYWTYAKRVKHVLKDSGHMTRVMSSSRHDNGQKPPPEGDTSKTNMAGVIKTGKLQDVVNTLLKTSGSQMSRDDTPGSYTSEQQKDDIETIVKVQQTLKNIKRAKMDISKSYYDNIYIPTVRALNEYLLTGEDLDALPRAKKRSPYPEKQAISVYLQKDVERIAIIKWGSLEKLQAEKKKRDEIERNRNLFGTGIHVMDDSLHIEMSPTTSKQEQRTRRVVHYAIAINSVNAAVKLFAWVLTGSHSMFSEFIHSVADTANQVILALGLHQSQKQPDLEHPYGWTSFRNVASLISGVGIFCLGAGLSFYHGIHGLMHPHEITSLHWAMGLLLGSFVSEGATLVMAMNQIRHSSRIQKMSVMDYIWRGQDPSTNVVLLEDAAAVIGVVIALGCMGITHLTGNPMADAVGSLCIGTLLGGVASFIIYTNSITLVGRSIPPDKKRELMYELESDRMIRTLHDVKATDIGGSYVRFKAEVDFDGREITRYYLENQDLDQLLQEVQKFGTIDEMESFLLHHGENIVDTLGSQVDRIEKNLKRKHPEVRHVDLEQL